MKSYQMIKEVSQYIGKRFEEKRKNLEKIAIHGDKIADEKGLYRPNENYQELLKSINYSKIGFGLDFNVWNSGVYNESWWVHYLRKISEKANSEDISISKAIEKFYQKHNIQEILRKRVIWRRDSGWPQPYKWAPVLDVWLAYSLDHIKDVKEAKKLLDGLPTKQQTF